MVGKLLCEKQNVGVWSIHSTSIKKCLPFFGRNDHLIKLDKTTFRLLPKPSLYWSNARANSQKTPHQRGFHNFSKQNECWQPGLDDVAQGQTASVGLDMD